MGLAAVLVYLVNLRMLYIWTAYKLAEVYLVWISEVVLHLTQLFSDLLREWKTS